MNPEQLNEILESHRKWLIGDPKGHQADLREADLCGAYLCGAYLCGANLRGANFHEADLHEADLYRANLCGANLRYANLSRANLRGANLHGADLYRANLCGANLHEANLHEANLYKTDLRGTDLRYANLHETDLRGVKLPSPTMVLLALWGNLSKELTQRAMAYDAAAHPDPSAFDRWAEGGPCPYKSLGIERACHFREQRKWWDPTVSAPRAFDLMRDFIREICKDSDFHIEVVVGHTQV